MGKRIKNEPTNAADHLRQLVHHYQQMHEWRRRHECETPERGAEQRETTHRIALALAMKQAEAFLAAAA